MNQSATDEEDTKKEVVVVTAPPSEPQTDRNGILENTPVTTLRRDSSNDAKLATDRALPKIHFNSSEVNEESEGDEHGDDCSKHSTPSTVFVKETSDDGCEDETDECGSLPESSLKPLDTSVAKSTNSRRQRNSLALRKNTPINFSSALAVSSEISHDVNANASNDLQATVDGSVTSGISSRGKKDGIRVISTPSGWNLLRSTCLNPALSLRTQLMLSFGFVSITMISFVMVVCIAVAILSGQNVNKETVDSFDALTLRIEGKTVRYMAEFLTYRLIPDDLVNIVWEMARDRMAGYPSAPGYAEDNHVPFFDIDSGTNRYPIVFPPLPLSWQLKNNVNKDNYKEHIHDRWQWYTAHGSELGLSTRSAMYLMQGTCDPNATDTITSENCTEANNDIRTGGSITPTETNALLHRKSADLSPALKAMYEYHQDVKSLGIAFANDGAGSAVQFPHYESHTRGFYTSEGCDWMRQPNPFAPKRSIGTEGMIERCHPAGTRVSYRNYNPMEQGWCQKQALEPFKVHSDGPHIDPSWYGTDEQLWSLIVGRAIYDRVTNEFIGCIRINVVLEFLKQALLESRVTESSHATVVRCDVEGTVIASSAWKMATKNETITIDALNVGVTKETYSELMNLVNYDEPWESSDLRKAYEAFAVEQDGFTIGAYPMPPPPASYDPTYKPAFFAIKSINSEDVFGQLYSSQEWVDDRVEKLVNLSLLIGIIGILVVLLITAMVANRLTSPLRFMNEVASEIVSTYVNSNEDGIDFSQPTKYASCCTPKTEVSEVVAEFQKTIGRFSGTANAKAMKQVYTEVKNRFDMFEEFADVYKSRQSVGFSYNIPDGNYQKSAEDMSNSTQNDVLKRQHLGTLLCGEEGDVSRLGTLRRGSSTGSMAYASAKKRRGFASPLFFWIVFLIATPLLVTTSTLSIIVMYHISVDFPALVEEVRANFVDLDLFALQVYVNLRANFVSEVTSRSTRDLHLGSRYISWLIFGGIKRSESFTELTSGAEACKTSASLAECQYVEEHPCDCSWHDKTPDTTCQYYNDDTRYLQVPFFTCESLDTMADGDRNTTSYPAVASSPIETAWWTDVNSVPGSQKGSTASGHDTTYDRLRVLSAMPLYAPLYNYDNYKNRVEGMFVAMEEDGLFLGYYGCQPMAFVSQWQSSKENGAPNFRPELCPEGKYGFDPRCREWYNTGRQGYLENNTFIHLTSPYLFGRGDRHGQSATAALFDPKTKRHVGQALVDFQTTPIFEALNAENTPFEEGGFPVMITPDNDIFGGDTVIAPGYSSDMGSRPITEILRGMNLFACTESDCGQLEVAFETVSKMKRGEKNLSSVPTTGDDGSVANAFAAYAPVKVKILTPRNSSDFASGVDSTDHMIYSLSFAVSERAILAPFKAIEDDVARQRNIAIVILCIVILLSTLLVVYLSNIFAVSIANPMLYLLDLIRHINRLSADGVITSGPEVERDFGCREVRNVSRTLEVLYKVVRDANVAFFAGDIELAYAVLIDTSRLFQRLGNKKAIGVSNNNLGNMMLTMYRTMEVTGDEYVCGFTRQEIVQKGVSYFHKAIKLGEASYDEFYETEGWSPNCLEFMQHLSNRYFNRAMFLLTVKYSHRNPAELEQLGLRDLQIVRDMDVEIVDEGTQVGWNVRTAEQLFDVKLGRIKGHLQLLEMGYPDDWGVDELLEDAFQLVRDELKKKDSSNLFEELNIAGRMQQVECEMTRYMVLKGDLKTAAKIAIRMLLEDEFTLPDAQTQAVDALLKYVRSKEYEENLNPDVEHTLSQYKIWLSAMADENDVRMSSTISHPEHKDDNMSEVFQLSTAKFSTVSTRNDRESLKTTLRQSTRGDFTMEVF